MKSTSNVQVTVFGVFRSVTDPLHSDPAAKLRHPRTPVRFALSPTTRRTL
jgi:hypothetical protein